MTTALRTCIYSTLGHENVGLRSSTPRDTIWFDDMTMTKTLFAITLSGLMLLLCGTPFADEHTDWVGTVTDPDIEYRTHVYENSEVCNLEYRDTQSGTGATTFDAAVDYKSKDHDHDDEQVMKTDRENIATTPTSYGSARISNCFGVIAVRLTYVKRH
jgi:hypothetical protein